MGSEQDDGRYRLQIVVRVFARVTAERLAATASSPFLSWPAYGDIFILSRACYCRRCTFHTSYYFHIFLFQTYCLLGSRIDDDDDDDYAVQFRTDAIVYTGIYRDLNKWMILAREWCMLELRLVVLLNSKWWLTLQRGVTGTARIQ